MNETVKAGEIEQIEAQANEAWTTFVLHGADRCRLPLRLCEEHRALWDRADGLTRVWKQMKVEVAR